MYYYVNILLTKNALNTFISNENNFVQNHLLRSADSISFSFIPVAYSALLCWSPASIDFNGAALNSFFQCLETRRSLDNAAIMSRPRTLSVSGMNGGVGWPGLRASAWWLEGLSSLFNPLLCPKTLVFWGRQLIKMYLLFFLACLLVWTSQLAKCTAGVERSFYCLKRLKSYTRNTMGQGRLSSLALLAIEKTLVKSLEKTPSWYDRVTEHFLEKERRAEFTYK